ncbi:hypothetical protein C4J83_3511 [Pseudomonas sp. LBUM920]|nr:hypothetical protein C4J83_3511 [Pseudomonas sp. LBUM920]
MHRHSPKGAGEGIVGGCQANGNRLCAMSEILADMTLLKLFSTPNIPSTN